MENILALILLVDLIACFASTIGFIIKWITKKPKKKWGKVAIITFAIFWCIGILFAAFSCEHEWIEESRTNPSCEDPGVVEYRCSLCNDTMSESIDALGHDMKIISRIEPTENAKGEILKQCKRCNLEKVEKLDKLPPPKTENKPNKTNSEQIDSSVTFDEIYNAYEENELRADDSYKNNRYKITAKINCMETDGLSNLTGGATLTMEKRVGNTIVFFYAEFEKDQEKALKSVNVGDTITFEGECLSAGSWVDCVLSQ